MGMASTLRAFENYCIESPALTCMYFTFNKVVESNRMPHTAPRDTRAALSNTATAMHATARQPSCLVAANRAQARTVRV